MSEICAIHGLEVLDSRGMPTVQATVELYDGTKGVALVPSGASTGSHEAIELRDQCCRYNGNGVKKALTAVNHEIAGALCGLSAEDQVNLDNAMIELDGTPNKSRLGSNSILAVSLAACRAAASYYNQPLFRYLGGLTANIMPIPMVNVINGGAHANNSLDIQEFMLVPNGFDSFSTALEATCETFYSLKKLLNQRGYSTAVGDEGGFAPYLKSENEAIELVLEAIEKAGYKIKDHFELALDLAFTEYYSSKECIYRIGEQKKVFSSQQVVELCKSMVDQYPITSLEDPLAEDDWEGWRLLTKELSSSIQLVGDDLFVTNTSRLTRGIDSKVANAILIKPNQCGTLTETLAAMDLARKNDYNSIVSHRSGETEDTFISDLAVASGCGQIKAGSVSRSDRTAKYNRLLQIEDDLSFS